MCDYAKSFKLKLPTRFARPLTSFIIMVLLSLLMSNITEWCLLISTNVVSFRTRVRSINAISVVVIRSSTGGMIRYTVRYVSGVRDDSLCPAVREIPYISARFGIRYIRRIDYNESYTKTLCGCGMIRGSLYPRERLVRFRPLRMAPQLWIWISDGRFC